MGRPSKEELEKRKAAEEQAEQQLNQDAAINAGDQGETIIGEGGNITTGPIEGEIQDLDLSKAEREAGLIPVEENVTESQKEELTEEDKTTLENINSGNLPEGDVNNPDTIQQSEGSGEENNAISAEADGSENELSSEGTDVSGTLKNLDPNPGAELTEVPNSGQSAESEEAGVQVGDTLDAAREKIDGLREEKLNNGESDFNVPVPASKPVVTQEDLNEVPFAEEAGITLGMDREEAFQKFKAHLEANPHLYPTDHPNYKAKEEAPAEEVDPESYVYHGDFLTEGQLEMPNITYDWDEVTAPDHLAAKPEIHKPFTDRG